MNVDDAKWIIQNEKLKNYCLYCNETNREDEVVIMKENGVWRVYTNDERATKIGEKIYKNESETLIDFIERLRGDKAVREYYNNP